MGHWQLENGGIGSRQWGHKRQGDGALQAVRGAPAAGDGVGHQRVGAIGVYWGTGVLGYWCTGVQA